MIRLACYLAILFALPFAAQAEIYKWTDGKGHVRYSDVPPAGNAPYVTVPGAKSRAAVPSHSIADSGPSSSQGKSQGSAEIARKKQQGAEAEQKLRKDNCSAASANLKTFKQGGLVTRLNDKGESEYLTDADIAYGLQQSEKDVKQYCD